MKIKKYCLFFTILVFVFFCFSQAQADFPQDTGNEIEGNTGGWTTGMEKIGEFGLSDKNHDAILENILLWIFKIFTILAVLAFVISGIMFLISGGNQDMTSRAKEYIKYSIIALVIALSGYIVINFIDTMLKGTL